jgi:hypothetical protein
MMRDPSGETSLPPTGIDRGPLQRFAGASQAAGRRETLERGVLIVSLRRGGFVKHIADFLGDSIADLVEGQCVCKENHADYRQENEHYITSVMQHLLCRYTQT